MLAMNKESRVQISSEDVAEILGIKKKEVEKQLAIIGVRKGENCFLAGLMRQTKDSFKDAGMTYVMDEKFLSRLNEKYKNERLAEICKNGYESEIINNKMESGKPFIIIAMEVCDEE